MPRKPATNSPALRITTAGIRAGTFSGRLAEKRAVSTAPRLFGHERTGTLSDLCRFVFGLGDGDGDHGGDAMIRDRPQRLTPIAAPGTLLKRLSAVHASWQLARVTDGADE